MSWSWLPVRYLGPGLMFGNLAMLTLRINERRVDNRIRGLVDLLLNPTASGLSTIVPNGFA